MRKRNLFPWEQETKAMKLKAGLAVEINGHTYKATQRPVSDDICACDCCKIGDLCISDVFDICVIMEEGPQKGWYLELVK